MVWRQVIQCFSISIRPECSRFFFVTDLIKLNSFQSGDTIGCGYDSTSRDLFFTRNGTRMPANDVLRNFKEEAAIKLCPTISLSSPHDTVLINMSGNFK